LAKVGRITPFKDECVIYYSQEDRAWIAHSLYTDQLGYGDCVVDAIVDLLVGTRNILALYEKDPDIEVQRQAPPEIQRYRESAQRLPDVLWEVAQARLHKQLRWDTYVDIPTDQTLIYEFQEPQYV
jgi:hypothetical protein